MPKMSFGTGHHATTRLMIEAMQAINFANSTVLDFGTGTGILAILAAKLGASYIAAIDNEEWAAENAQENIRLNNTANVAIHLGTLDVIATQTFDIILANINRHILLAYMQTLYALLNAGGTLLMSGLLQEDELLIRQAAQDAGFILGHTSVLNNWIAIQVHKTKC
jgi:ribosomal protein L11 methyltransferase